MNLNGRVAKLEAALGPRDAGLCQCATVPGVSGWRVLDADGAFWRGEAADLVAVCKVCGLRRPVASLEPVEWRNNYDKESQEW